MSQDNNAPGLGDMFLMVKGQKMGLIKGEAQDATHGGEIDVVSWSWGMEASPVMGGGYQKKVAVRDLKVVKRVDAASVPLMQAMRQNDTITKAVLTLRKAGKTPLEFLKVTIGEGRVTELSVQADIAGPQLFETIRFSFNKIEVEYVGQGADGQKLGGMLYSDEFSNKS